MYQIMRAQCLPGQEAKYCKLHKMLTIVRSRKTHDILVNSFAFQFIS